MEFIELQAFVTVASERSFSRAAARLGRTQPAISQAIHRLERQVGERLFDRSSKPGELTDAGRVLLGFAQRLLTLRDEAGVAVAELRDLRRGQVRVGANESAIHALLPIIDAFRRVYPLVHVEVRRTPARQIGAEIVQGGLDCGVLSFRPTEAGLQSVVLGTDELVLLVAPSHPLAASGQVRIADLGLETFVAHNEPSPNRERVIRLFEQRRTPLNIGIALGSLDGIKRAVELGLGVALLPRRCALAEIARGQLVPVRVLDARLPRQLRLVYAAAARRSHAAAAFLEIARNTPGVEQAVGTETPS